MLGNPVSYTDPKGLFVPLAIPFVCAAGGCEALGAALAGGAILWASQHPVHVPGSNANLPSTLGPLLNESGEKSWPTFPSFDPTNTSGANNEIREKCYTAYVAQIEVCKMTSATPRAREACYASAANVYAACLKKGCR